MRFIPQNLSPLGLVAFIVIVSEWFTTTCSAVQHIGLIVNSVQTQGGIVNGSGNSNSTAAESGTQTSISLSFHWLILFLVLDIIFFIIETCIYLGFTVAVMRKVQFVFLECWCRLNLYFLLLRGVFSFFHAFVYPTVKPSDGSLGTPMFVVVVFEVCIFLAYAKELKDQGGLHNENIIARVV